MAKTKTHTCSMCGGSGTVPVARDRRQGEKSCPNCGGNGEVGR